MEKSVSISSTKLEEEEEELEEEEEEVEEKFEEEEEKEEEDTFIAIEYCLPVKKSSRNICFGGFVITDD